MDSLGMPLDSMHKRRASGRERELRQRRESED
jgi:hypothetical protein